MSQRGHGKASWGRADYDLDAASVAIAPFDIDCGSLPEFPEPSPRFLDIVPDTVRRVVGVEGQPFVRSLVERNKALQNAPVVP